MLKLVTGDGNPPILYQYVDGTTDLPITDAASYTPGLKLRKRGTTTVLQTVAGSWVDEGAAQASFAVPTGGWTDTVGYYEFEFYLTDGSGKVETVYKVEKARFRDDF
jgi:hypothetical protein